MNPIIHSTSNRHAYRNGTTLLELVVAAVLISTMISVAAPLILRCNRLWQDTQRVQLATDEVTDQLERLVAMNPAERSVALQSLTVSEDVARVFPDSTLRGTLAEDDLGRRIILEFDWKRPGDPLPVTLVRWLDALPESESASKPDEETSADPTEEQS